MSKKKQKNKILEHQLEEWKYLNDYINQMDLNYQKLLTIMVSIFAGATVLFASDKNPNLLIGIFIIPPGIIAVFSYLSYQFRITAILRGHLAALEKEMNETLNKDVHLWNSALVETFMAHNNSINKYMMLPLMVFILIIMIYCVIFTLKVALKWKYGLYIFIPYWIIMLVGAIIVGVPFLKNEEIRRETENEANVISAYKTYLNKINEPKKFRYEE